MTTPTPRTDAALDKLNAQIRASCDDTFAEVAAWDFARELERELTQRDALIQRILDYPYLPQNLATIIRKELENVSR